MEVKFQIEYQEAVVKQHIPRLSSKDKLLIKQSIENKLKFDPVSFGKPLRYSMKGHRRLRVGDYRVVYKIIIKTHTVVIIAIKHRSEIY